ncbi:MAG: Lon-like protease [Acidimicrobiaceae bacterium]|nr:Lon-like protease [Acidimicrobiaceae bacterium]
MVVRGPLAWDEPEPQPSRRWLAAVIAATLAVGLLVASVTVQLPYYALAPGSAKQVNDLINADSPIYTPKGRVLMATVSLRRAQPIDVIEGWFDDDIEIVKEEQIVGRTPPKQYHQLNLQAMDESKRTAIVVALRKLGHDVPAHGQGSLITNVIPGRGFPAEGHLQQGDVITEVDGQPVQFVEDAVRLLHQHKPGDAVRLQVTGVDGASRIEQLVMARNDDGTAVLGIELQTFKLDYDVPFKVDIDSADIGGPSAGLAFTLGVLDELTPGELTGGKVVAATGTIGIDGAVGDVGGVPQKTAAVIDAGAKVFLVPPGEYEQARKRAGKRLQVIKVATLDEALAVLGRLGGNASALGFGSGGAPG